MPLTLPPDGASVDMVDRLRELLETEMVPGVYYTGPIKEFPPSGVSEADEVVVSLHLWAEEPGPETMSTQRENPYIVLTITVFEGTNPDHAAVLRRLVNITRLFRQAAWKYRAGPPTPPRDWHGLRFATAPGQPFPTVYDREPEQWQRSITVISLKSQRSNP